MESLVCSKQIMEKSNNDELCFTTKLKFCLIIESIDAIIFLFGLIVYQNTCVKGFKIGQ